MATKYKILLLIFTVVVLADQATKYWAVKHLTNAFESANRDTTRGRIHGFFTLKNLDNEPYQPGNVDHRLPPVEVVHDYWNHKYVENPGAAWGLLAGVSDEFRIPFFHLVSVVAILFIGMFYRRLEEDQRVLAVALSLVLGGAVGNYIDRLARNYVIDFIDWHWRNRPELHWPTFNVADLGICVGVGLMLAETLFAKRRYEEQVPAPPEAMPLMERAPETPSLTAEAPQPVSQEIRLPDSSPIIVGDPRVEPAAETTAEPHVPPNGAHGNEKPS